MDYCCTAQLNNEHLWELSVYEIANNYNYDRNWILEDNNTSSFHTKREVVVWTNVTTQTGGL